MVLYKLSLCDSPAAFHSLSKNTAPFLAGNIGNKGFVCVVIFSQPPDSVFKVVKSFDESLLVSKQLLTSGAVEKIWVLGGKQIYQVRDAYVVTCSWW